MCTVGNLFGVISRFIFFLGSQLLPRSNKRRRGFPHTIIINYRFDARSHANVLLARRDPPEITSRLDYFAASFRGFLLCELLST